MQLEPYIYLKYLENTKEKFTYGIFEAFFLAVGLFCESHIDNDQGFPLLVQRNKIKVRDRKTDCQSCEDVYIFCSDPGAESNGHQFLRTLALF